MSRKNIVLAALFVRLDLHDWSIKVPQLRAELLLPIEPSVDENLESTAPVDYMCCVLIGVFSEVLKHKKILPVWIKV